MEDSAVKIPQRCCKVQPAEKDEMLRSRNKYLGYFCLVIVSMTVYSMLSIWCLRTEVDTLQKKVTLLTLGYQQKYEMLKTWHMLLIHELEIEYKKKASSIKSLDLEKRVGTDSSVQITNEIQPPSESTEDNYYIDEREGNARNVKEDEEHKVKRKREIRDHESSAEDSFKSTINETENKSAGMAISAETTEILLEKSTERILREKFISSNDRLTRKSHAHRKHKKPRIGSAEKFFTETHSTTSSPIQVRRSRTKATEHHNADKKFQQHTSPHKDTITKEEAALKGYRLLEDASYEVEPPKEHGLDLLSYNMITIHFSADTSHYSKDRDPHYFGNGRMQIKSDIYKDWKPAHWTQGVGMSQYFHLSQGRVTISTTGIYLIYAQIQYSNVQEVNGFSVFRNNDVVVQCITTSTHPDKHEIKSNTCGISTTILLQSNESVCIKDLHHGRYVVLTPEKSYFGLVLLSPFKK